MNNRRHAFITTAHLQECVGILCAYLQNPKATHVSIIAPNVRDAELLNEHLVSFNPLLVTGADSNAHRFQTWIKFRTQKKSVLIATRVGLLLTNPDISSIVLVRSGHKNHRQADRNPRFDTRVTSWMLHEQMHCKLFFMDVLPRVDEVALFSPSNRVGREYVTKVELVDMNKERPTAPHPIIGSTTMAAIDNALQTGNQAICVYNKKGGDIFGNQQVAQALKTMFPDTVVQIIEKGRSRLPKQKKSILLVTNYYLENLFDPFNPPASALVALLDIDTALYSSSFRAFEHAALSLEEWRGVAYACKARLLIQTQQPELFSRYLEDPSQILETELQHRIVYQQPPARRWFRISYKTEEPKEAQVVLHTLRQQIEEKAPETIFVEEEGLDLGILSDDCALILKLLSKLDDAYIIDTTAFL